MPADRPRRSHALPAGVWVLGFVSMFMDVSSEMVHALLPVYLVAVLGATTLEVGVIEGIAEATAAITKVFSGALSDWLGKRKLLAGLGYGLAALVKPVFPLATSLGWVVAARFVDRVGKGIRGAPRDALVADIAPPDQRGAAFGLRQSLDTVGAFLGPLAAMALMWATAGAFRTVFWVAVIPALLAVVLLVALVKEPPHRAAPLRRVPLRRAELARLSHRYWAVVAVASVFTLARFSEAFLILRGQSIALPDDLIPGVLVVMNLAYALSAYPAGRLSDGMERLHLLLLGLGVLVAADLVLAFAGGVAEVLLGAALWGLHMGLTQGILATLVADEAPAALRGTAFGMFNLVTGAALLIASALAGALWTEAGPEATFLGGAVLALLSASGLLALRRRSGAA
ncbi:MFS transporter [bacterium]|nr:MFS transporter [bacterium]